MKKVYWAALILMRKVSNQTTFYKVHTISIHHKWALEIKSKKIIIVEFHHNTYFVNVDVTTVLIKFLYGKIKPKKQRT